MPRAAERLTLVVGPDPVWLQGSWVGLVNYTGFV